MEDSMLGLIPIKDSEFHEISKMIYDKFGINLTEQKKSLVVGRLNKVLRKKGFTNFRDYFDYVSNDPSGEALSVLIDKISTNHTYFFREYDHFDLLEKSVLPEITEKKILEGNKKLRIWSAGCASGEEIYTIAMLLREYFGENIFQWDIGLLATDISGTALNEAILGEYPVDKIKELPVSYKHKYLKMVGKDTVAVDPSIRESVLFKRLNLMRESFPFTGKFDIVFCRNVMIYFDNSTRRDLVERIFQVVQDGGYLFIGHSESLGRDNCPFDYIKPAVYKKGT